MKKKITYSEYLQLHGLLTLASTHNRELVQIERAVGELIGEPFDGPGSGHAGDFTYGAESGVDRLLEKTKIAVVPPPAKRTKHAKA